MNIFYCVNDNSGERKEKINCKTLEWKIISKNMLALIFLDILREYV